MKILLALLLLTSTAFAQQPQQQVDPLKLVPILQSQRDTANNQVVLCSVQAADLVEKVKQLEAELAKLKTAEK